MTRSVSTAACMHSDCSNQEQIITEFVLTDVPKTKLYSYWADEFSPPSTNRWCGYKAMESTQARQVLTNWATFMGEKCHLPEYQSATNPRNSGFREGQ